MGMVWVCRDGRVSMVVSAGSGAAARATETVGVTATGGADARRAATCAGVAAASTFGLEITIPRCPGSARFLRASDAAARAPSDVMARASDPTGRDLARRARESRACAGHFSPRGDATGSSRC